MNHQAMGFQEIARDGRARAGVLKLPHGDVETPVFMPVGTQATVKTLSQEDIEKIGARLILGNAYHLYLRPGLEILEAAGGLHGFMNWKGNLLTDSGGFQVFSLANLKKINDEGVEFQSHIDGSRHFLTPEKVVEIERVIGADIMMVLDECVEGDASRAKVEEALKRTTAWAKRAKIAFDERDDGTQNLFGIVQGGVFEDLRRRSAREIGELDFPGNAIGGLSVGEERGAMYDMLSVMDEELPDQKPRYLMGVGVPEDILEAIERGVDMFDCVFPTRAARHATVFTRRGQIHLKNAAYVKDFSQIEEDCQCATCSRYSRAYLRHLFMAREMTAYRLASIHNLSFLHRLTRNARQAIVDGCFASFKREFLENYRETLSSG